MCWCWRMKWWCQMESKASEKVVDLTDFEHPDCKACQDPTKRVAAKTFDLEGPGQVGVIYTCENMPCRRVRNAKDLFLIRTPEK